MQESKNNNCNAFAISSHEHFFKLLKSLLKIHISTFENLNVSRIFTKTNCNFSHIVACMICRLSARFSKKFFTFCEIVAGISFEFVCHAAIVKVSYSEFRDSSRSPFELCAWKIPTRPLSFSSLSAYYDGNYTSEISVDEEHRFYRLSFRCPPFDIFHVLFNCLSVFLTMRSEKKIYSNNYKGDNYKFYM